MDPSHLVPIASSNRKSANFSPRILSGSVTRFASPPILEAVKVKVKKTASLTLGSSTSCSPAVRSNAVTLTPSTSPSPASQSPLTNNQRRIESLTTQALALYESEKFTEAFPLIHRLATQHNVTSMYFPLAFLYDNGFGCKKNLRSAIQYYQRAHKHANSKFAAHNLGVIFQHGIRNVEKAKLWYTRSIDKWQYSNSYFNLAVLYKDLGDYEKARELYERAAEQGHDGALNNLGTLWQEGLGCEVNVHKAFEYYMRASGLNNKYALKNAAGYLLDRGEITKAITYLKASADQGFDAAMKRLGDLYDTDDYGIKNLPEATKWYGLGAKNGNAECFFKMGFALQTGRGIRKSLPKAAVYYRRSIEHTNSSPAKHNLAIILSSQKNPDGSTRTDRGEEAAALYQSAIENGYTLSANNLARLYRYGSGVKKCYKRAVYYYELGAQHGHADSVNGLGTMYENGHGVPKDMRKAFELYMRAAQNMYPFALFNAGLCFEFGSGCERCVRSALKMYRLAVKRQHTHAQLRAEALLRLHRSQTVLGNL